MKISVLDKKDVARACGLLKCYEFNDYRAYRMLDKDSLFRYLFRQCIAPLRSRDGLLLIAEDNSGVIGLAGLFFLSWDTKHFGVNMARVDFLMAAGGYPQAREVKKSLLSFLMKLCWDKKIAYLSCRIDTADICTVHALEENGFLLMDTIVTYAFNRRRHPIPNMKDIYKIRLFRKTDLPALQDLAGRAFSKDRFHLDPHIAAEKASGLFKGWVKDSCAKRSSHKVFVAQKSGEVAGFLTFELNKELERLSGYKIAGHGLSAVSPQAKGAYVSLVKAAVEEIVSHYDCLEFDTQLNNYEVIRVWQRFGFDFIRAKHTFHKWMK
ncbi:MAG: GNAT family N-acetyltransferase [bacterium]